jgi:hypothetical protein
MFYSKLLLSSFQNVRLVLASTARHHPNGKHLLNAPRLFVKCVHMLVWMYSNCVSCYRTAAVLHKDNTTKQASDCSGAGQDAEHTALHFPYSS